MILYFPYVKYETKGIINYTVNQNTNNIPIKLSSSTLDPVTKRESIYYDNDNAYFCSLTKCGTFNYLIIEFETFFFKVFGYIIKSENKRDEWYLKSWKLEGSIDNKNWEKLHSQDDVEKLSEQEGGSYSISNHKIFKYLKITQTGNAAGYNNDMKCRLRIDYFDIFGIISDRLEFRFYTKSWNNIFISFNYLICFICLK